MVQQFNCTSPPPSPSAPPSLLDGLSLSLLGEWFKSVSSLYFLFIESVDELLLCIGG